MSDRVVARALGWTSIAIGLTEIFATDWLQKQMGVKGHNKLIKGLGAREIAAGIGLLSADSAPAQAAGLWSRVAGDAMDLALVGAAAKESKNKMGLGLVSLAVLPVIAADVYYATQAKGNRKLTKYARVAAHPVQETVSTVAARLKDYLPAS